MSTVKRRDRLALMCDDCNEEIFVDVNMIMVRDELWASIISAKPKLKTEDSLCACCMERRRPMPLTRDDWKPGTGHTPYPLANYMTEAYRNSAEGKEYEKKIATKKTRK